MRIVAKFVNGNNAISIDDSTHAYAYLGKYPVPNSPRYCDVDVTCVGVPLVYFSVPYGRTDRAGVAMAGLRSLGGNAWRVSLLVNNPGNVDLGQSIRIFGRVDLNFPAGSGVPAGLRIWSLVDRGLVFDSGLRMHKTAGNTSAIELTLTPSVPTGAQPVSAYDTNFAIPFDMADKSICANTRGVVRYPELIGGYNDWDTGQWIDQYMLRQFTTVYWANGSALTAARVGFDERIFEHTGPYVVSLENFQTVYSRLAVIDNTKFP
ncbi:hypothetical protein [Undibacterium curvum]|uniref:hypothetical protein n=1 Tax=Undibacterium curvum TaxID=2762294 RepID=UPI003D0D3D30